MYAAIESQSSKFIQSFIVDIFSFQKNIFVRCVKSNHFSQPSRFDNSSVENQLKCFGLAEFKELMEQGFPNRFEFEQLLNLYGIKIIKQKVFHIVLLLQSLGLDKNDYRIGHTRVCLRPLKSHILEKISTPNDDDIVEVQEKLDKTRLNIRNRWLNIVNSALENENKISSACCVDIKLKVIAENNIIPDISNSNNGIADLHIPKTISSNVNFVKDRSHKKNTTQRRQKKEDRFDGVQFDRLDHLPDIESKPSRTRCKLKGCNLKTNFYCIKCKKHLCIKKQNCFVQYHTQKLLE